MNPIIKSSENQKLTAQMKDEIDAAFWEEFQIWQDNEQINLKGQYVLTVCEPVAMSENPKDSIAVLIEKNSEFGGYLHVYGMKEI